MTTSVFEHPSTPLADQVFDATLRDMHQLVDALEHAIHHGAPTEAIWRDLARCGTVIAAAARN